MLGLPKALQAGACLHAQISISTSKTNAAVVSTFEPDSRHREVRRLTILLIEARLSSSQHLKLGLSMRQMNVQRVAECFMIMDDQPSCPLRLRIHAEQVFVFIPQPQQQGPASTAGTYACGTTSHSNLRCLQASVALTPPDLTTQCPRSQGGGGQRAVSPQQRQHEPAGVTASVLDQASWLLGADNSSMSGGPSSGFPFAAPPPASGGPGNAGPATGFAFGGAAATPSQQQRSNPSGFGGSGGSSPAPSLAPAAPQPSANPFGFGSAATSQAQACLCSTLCYAAVPVLAPFYALLSIAAAAHLSGSPSDTPSVAEWRIWVHTLSFCASICKQQHRRLRRLWQL